MSELKKTVSLSDNGLRRNLRSLQEKLAIEILGTHDNVTARTWRVYSFNAILERRRATGMVWVVRNRSSVDLVKAPAKAVTMAGPATVAGGATVAPPPPATVAPPLVTYLDTRETSSTSFAPSPNSTPPPREIVEAFQRIAKHSDDEAAYRIVAGCQAVAPDVTPEEIADRMFHMAARISEINERAERAGKSAVRIANPVGFLMTEVPKCFGPASLPTFRAEREKQLEAERKRLKAEAKHRQEKRQRYAAEIEKHRRTLANPNAEDWRRQHAQESLDLDVEQRQILADPNSSPEAIATAKTFLHED